MLDELKKKRKQEADDAKLAIAKRQKKDTGRPTEKHTDIALGSTLPRTHEQLSLESPSDSRALVLYKSAPKDDLDEISIDKDDGYAIEHGNLHKDGILVASGHVFDED